MLQLKLDAFMTERGIAEKTKRRNLVKQGFTYPKALRLLKGNIAELRLDELFTLCQYLHCTPQDLIKYVPTNEHELAPNHPLQACRYLHNGTPVVEILKTLSPESLKHAQEYLKGL